MKMECFHMKTMLQHMKMMLYHMKMVRYHMKRICFHMKIMRCQIFFTLLSISKYTIIKYSAAILKLFGAGKNYKRQFRITNRVFVIPEAWFVILNGAPKFRRHVPYYGRGIQNSGSMVVILNGDPKFRKPVP